MIGVLSVPLSGFMNEEAQEDNSINDKIATNQPEKLLV